MKRLVGAVIAVLVAAPTAVAQAPGLTLTATDKPVGHIGLALEGPAGATLAVSETTGRDRPLTDVTLDAAGRAAVPDAATWSCERRRRTFRAEGAGPDGTALRADAEVRTPGCANRYALAVRPKRPRTGKTVTARLTDRFGLGDLEGRLCVGRRCVPFALAPDERSIRVQVRAPGAGRARVTARAGGRVLDRVRIKVRRPKHLDLLATGDSMIQIIDGYLKQRLAPRNVGVRSDARISTGLSKPSFFDWPEHAVKQARAGADITVMFIGANDGFPYGDVQCCGKAWRQRYADVVSRMMSTYARGGDARVYWCLLPAPRAGNFRRVFVAVNAAIRIAARRHRRTVRLVDLPRTFTPGFRYTETLNGRTVRQDDGVHLNAAGASVAANIIIRRMRRDGVL